MICVAVLLLWLLAVAAIAVWYRRDIGRLWREPVLKFPVLVLESDDWGAGPLEQASALDEVAAVLRRYRDASERRPVMSLAVVLAVPDGQAISTDYSVYQRICLDHPRLGDVLEALKRGEADGVFSLQLHGLEHFWPQALMASSDPLVQAWLREPSLAATERLPSHLQSRWVDVSRLPSARLPDAVVYSAVAEEMEVYHRIFGRKATLVVPPTFVWTPAVEQAWAMNGIECVITPGRRYTRRISDGSCADDGERFANGDRARGVTYLVRYDYFEPNRGRDAAHALRALRRAIAEARPGVFENHRANFCDNPKMRARSLQELEDLLSGALTLDPRMRFLSSSDLFRILERRDPAWIHLSISKRLPFLWQRLRHTGRLWKLLMLSGAALPGELLMRSIAHAPSRSDI